MMISQTIQRAIVLTNIQTNTTETNQRRYAIATQLLVTGLMQFRDKYTVSISPNTALNFIESLQVVACLLS